MYRMIPLEESDKDLHRFVWKRDASEPLRDYRMTQVTFGVAALSYAANMAVKQNAEDFASELPVAAQAHSMWMMDWLAQTPLKKQSNCNTSCSSGLPEVVLFCESGVVAVLACWS